MAALVHPSSSEDELSAPWRRSCDKAFWFSRSAWSLLAIAKCWQRFTGQSSISVWLPDFFCNSSLVPLRTIGARLKLYPLTDNMAPDLVACRAMADEKHPDLFVLVHFFGQATPMDGVTEFCSNTGAWLIEDAAHVLRPISGIGEQGDFVLYSPHKHLSIPDGAVVVVREHGPGKLAIQPLALRFFQEDCRTILDTNGFSNTPAVRWLVKRMLQRLGVRDWRRTMTHFYTETDDPSSDLGHPRMSQLARHLLSSQLDTLDTIACLRNRNRDLWDQIVTQTKPTHQNIKIVPAESTPYLAAFSFDDEMLAEKMFFQWRRLGLPVTTWPDLPQEIPKQKKRHHRALQLRRTRVYLPVHQSLHPQKIINCARKLFKEE